MQSMVMVPPSDYHSMLMSYFTMVMYNNSFLHRLLMCRQCVVNKCHQLQLKQQIGNDYKRLCHLAKPRYMSYA